MSRYFLIILSFAIIGCSDDIFPKYVQLGGLRVLAIHSEKTSAPGQAEYSPGDTVTVTPHVSDFGSGARTLTYEAVGCLDPGVSYGVDASCAGSATAVTLASGTFTLSASDSYTGAGPSFQVTIPSTIFALRTAIDQYNGVAYLVTYRLTAPGAAVSSFKRLIVSSDSKTKNQNPALSSILAGGTALTSMPAGEVELSAGLTAGAEEAYLAMKSSGELDPRTEQVVTTYFITDGTLGFYRTSVGQTTKYTPVYPAPSDHTALIVAVSRDNRGGVAVKVQKLN
jgi:hypothetical protein